MAMRSLWQRLASLLGRAPRERIDPDIRDVFIAELDELSTLLSNQRAALRSTPVNPDALREVRRAFHTIKGSGLMAGAEVLGGFCARVEKLTLAMVEKRSRTPAETLKLIEAAIELLPDCARAIRADRPLPRAIVGLDRQARRLLGDADLVGS